MIFSEKLLDGYDLSLVIPISQVGIYLRAQVISLSVIHSNGPC
jgi:hypothetical protein